MLGKHDEEQLRAVLGCLAPEELPPKVVEAFTKRKYLMDRGCSGDVANLIIACGHKVVVPERVVPKSRDEVEAAKDAQLVGAGQN